MVCYMLILVPFVFPVVLRLLICVPAPVLTMMYPTFLFPWTKGVTVCPIIHWAIIHLDSVLFHCWLHTLCFKMFAWTLLYLHEFDCCVFGPFTCQLDERVWFWTSFFACESIWSKTVHILGYYNQLCLILYFSTLTVTFTSWINFASDILFFTFTWIYLWSKGSVIFTPLYVHFFQSMTYQLSLSTITDRVVCFRGGN